MVSILLEANKSYLVLAKGLKAKAGLSIFQGKKVLLEGWFEDEIHTSPALILNINDLRKPGMPKGDMVVVLTSPLEVDVMVWPLEG